MQIIFIEQSCYSIYQLTALRINRSCYKSTSNTLAFVKAWEYRVQTMLLGGDTRISKPLCNYRAVHRTNSTTLKLLFNSSSYN